MLNLSIIQESPAHLHSIRTCRIGLFFFVCEYYGSWLVNGANNWFLDDLCFVEGECRYLSYRACPGGQFDGYAQVVRNYHFINELP